MDFESIIRPVSVDDFRASIAASDAPLFIPGSSEKFAELFSERAYWHCLRQGKPEGQTVPRTSFTQYQLPLAFEAGAVSRALRSGNTVCVSYMDRVHDGLRQLCLDVESLLGLPGAACVHCYVSPPGTGYDFFHMDNGAAVTLQIAGSKTWHHAESPAVPWCTRVGGYREDDRLEWFGASDWHPTEPPSPWDQGFVERTLTPGDLLVMPPGVWHRAEATDTLSISLNLKLSATASIDALLQMVRQMCLYDERWRRPLPFASTDELQSGVASGRTQSELAAHVQRLSTTLQAIAEDSGTLARTWFRTFLGSQDDVGTGPDVSLTPQDRLAIPARVAPRLVVNADGTLALLGQGKILNVNGEAATDLLRALLEKRVFSLSEVAAWPQAQCLGPAGVRKTLEQLLHAGFLQLQNAR